MIKCVSAQLGGTASHVGSAHRVVGDIDEDAIGHVTTGCVTMVEGAVVIVMVTGTRATCSTMGTSVAWVIRHSVMSRPAQSKRKIFVEVNCVRQTVARAQHNARHACRSSKRHNELDRHRHGGHVERLEHEMLKDVLLVGLGVQKSFRE